MDQPKAERPGQGREGVKKLKICEHTFWMARYKQLLDHVYVNMFVQFRCYNPHT